MSKKKFSFTQKVWVWPGANAVWHFIYIDGPEKILLEKSAKEKAKTIRGMIPVHATIGNTTWETSAFLNKKENCYMLPLKKKVRES